MDRHAFVPVLDDPTGRFAELVTIAEQLHNAATGGTLPLHDKAAAPAAPAVRAHQHADRRDRVET